MCYVGCDNLRRLKNGRSYLFCFVRLVLHASELIMFVVYCRKLMLDYFGVSNMYVNHAIVVICVLLFSALFLFLACGFLKVKYITSIFYFHIYR